MNTKPNHTPTPWKAFGRTVYAGETPVALGIADFDAEVAPVYANDARHPLKDDAEGAANATFICLAVNAHDELLAALMLCARELKAMHSYHHPTCPGGCPFDEAFAAARAAIAKAKGETP